MAGRTIGTSRLQDEPTQVYGAHSLQSDAWQGTTKQGWSGNRVNSDGRMGAGIAQSTGGGQEAHFSEFESEQQDQAESTPHWSRMWEAGDQLSDHGQSALMVFRLVGGGKSSGFPMEFQSTHSENSSQR